MGPSIILNKIVFMIVLICGLVHLSTAAFIPSSQTEVNPATNTDNPGPIPPAYNILNKTYLTELDESHGPSNYSVTMLGGIRSRDSCTGSHYCTWSPWFSAKADQLSCELAYMKFDADAYYERYASYTERE